jgi:hypothetical protein
MDALEAELSQLEKLKESSANLSNNLKEMSKKLESMSQTFNG